MKAFSSLEDHEAVIGPSLDGGYYLLGITKYIKELFVDIPWSTDRVLDLTKSILEEKNISYKVLQPLKDIDYAADWHAQKHLLR